MEPHGREDAVSQQNSPYGAYGTEDARSSGEQQPTSPYLSSERSHNYGTPEGQYHGLDPSQSYNPWAIASLVLGLSMTAILAVVAGHVALVQIRRSGERGRGLAIAGLVLGYLEIVFYVALFMAAFGFLFWARSQT